MHRRSFLATVAATGALAGCAAPVRDEPGGDPGARTATSTPTPAPDPDLPLARRGRPPDVCSLDVRPVGIVAITEPRFDADWSGYDTSRYGGALDDDTTVVGVVRDGRARAYPVEVLWRHEIVNDEFGGPLLVTFCPLCASGMVAERVVGGDGEATTFGVSGLLWRPPGVETDRSREAGRVFGATLDEHDGVDPDRAPNLVMYDAATGSYWSQLLAEAICGPRRGTRLSIGPSTATSWADWASEHPDTTVLLPPPHSTARNPALPDA